MRGLAAPARVDSAELLDEPGAVLPDLAANLGDIRRLNRWFGGRAVALRHVRGALAGLHSARILDVATGSGDIPLAIWEWGGSRSLNLDIVAADVSSEILTEAAKVTAHSSIRLVQADARALPWGDSSFDLVSCCLALHHFAPADARRVLSEMWRVATRCVLIVDLLRSWPAYAAVYLVTRTFAHNRLSRHDGPLSVLRSYTSGELLALASEAGLTDVRLYRHTFVRQALVARKWDTSCE